MPFEEFLQEKKNDQSIPMISKKNINLLTKSLSKSENQAASNYIVFQKHFVKLNSLLNKNLDGIVLLSDSIPGFFELEGD